MFLMTVVKLFNKMTLLYLRNVGGLTYFVSVGILMFVVGPLLLNLDLIHGKLCVFNIIL